MSAWPPLSERQKSKISLANRTGVMRLTHKWILSREYVIFVYLHSFCYNQ